MVALATVSSLTLYAIYIEYAAYLMSQLYQEQIEQQQPTLDPATTITTHTRNIVTLPRDYDWEALNTYWSHRPISILYRFVQINYYLLPLVYRYVQDFIVRPKLQPSSFDTTWMDRTTIVSSPNHNTNHTNRTNNDATTTTTATVTTTTSNTTTSKFDDTDMTLELQRRHAVAWREALTQLGPAFIKAGQQISIRPDLVSPIVLQTLQQLCDNVTPISNEMAYSILKREFGIAHLMEIFVEPPQLVAAASLGQVYRGKLLNSNHQKVHRPSTTTTTTTTNTNDVEYTDVAIKIQRPGMLESFSLDLYLLQRFSIVVDTFTSLFTQQPPFHKALYESFACGSYSELDYENEARNQMYFYHEFQQRTLPIVIPQVYHDYTTRTVLTSQWIDGIKLADAPVEQIRALIPVGVELFLTQLLDLGLFHADPHVGNLLVQSQTGRLCLIDFGLCSTISEQDRRAMTMAIVHLLQRDFPTLIHQDSKDLGFLPHDCDTTELYPILTKILTVGLLDQPSSNIRVRRRKLLEISNELNDVFFHYPFTVPPYFALITRGLGLLEGIALSGDDNFDIFQAAAPYARRRAMQILYGRRSSKNKKNPINPTPGLPSTV